MRREGPQSCGLTEALGHTRGLETEESHGGGCREPGRESGEKLERSGQSPGGRRGKQQSSRQKTQTCLVAVGQVLSLDKCQREAGDRDGMPQPMTSFPGWHLFQEREPGLSERSQEAEGRTMPIGRVVRGA